ncbi:MAG: phospholipase D family protein, partial [Bacillota bacterium]
MLNPEDRKIYLEEIRPPVGYKLDRAIATTFSLDLLSLLMAPLSLALFDIDNRDEILKDPIAVLEAIRRTANRLAIFCQQGRIKVPRNDTRLFSYLEPIVYDVRPPGDGVFHPKVWVLRFSAVDEPVFYRFLCFSRNLTFDNSWDTVLKLEGNLEEDRSYGFPQNRPLTDFIRALPDMAVCDVNDKAKELIDLLAEEVYKVRFKTPEYFENEISFIPSGIKGYNKISEFKDFTRMMVISPFLSEQVIKSFTESGNDNILFSRGESLDKFEISFFSELKANTSVYILDDTVERPEETDEDSSEPVEESGNIIEEDFSGLHTKLYIAEKGWDASILTGSANATTTAFQGENVEFMVELTGKKSKVGIDRFFGIDDKQTTFRDLLRIYHRPEEDKIQDNIRMQLEKILDDARNELARCNLSVSIAENIDRTYSLIINSESKFKIKDDIEGYCYPIS